jgi:hypothetical protein
MEEYNDNLAHCSEAKKNKGNLHIVICLDYEKGDSTTCKGDHQNRSFFYLVSEESVTAKLGLLRVNITHC